jgi:hypothetical protein
MNIAIKTAGQWVRCVTGTDFRECRNMDTGAMYNLTPTVERKGIYELPLQFLRLPPRALLCGLSVIKPHVADGLKWTSRACKIVKNLIDSVPLRVYLNQVGPLPNSYYVFHSASCAGGYSVHINTALCAFDAAVADYKGLLHPIWPSDSPV